MMGDDNSQKIITIVSNPICPPCSKAHQLLDNWLSEDLTLGLRIVYSVLPGNSESTKSKVVRHLLALKLMKSEFLRQAMHDWYSQKEKQVDLWLEKFPVESGSEIETILAKQEQWCITAGITHTPTIFINGYKLRDPYSLEDIKYMI